MYFKKLELLGFKSFFDKTTLNFEPGITAVVGPNGCGKSNVVDSMRWVLGEQSAKALRGSDMQDVIFNGSDSKEPLGMSEVTLTFDNENRFFNFDHHEVAITRRLFRSGESEYLINKTPVRLKDIMDLLLGTGIGAESYSIVAQGKIDLVLSSRPEDRRLVFDEASGITKYKAQKRETLRKLEETEQNLTRINDIITEVKRQIGSLERQATKARKYKEVFEQLRQQEIDLALLERKKFLEQKNEIAKGLQELQAQETALQSLIKEEESKISNRQTELKAQEDSMMAVRNQILSLENQIVRNSERVNFNQEKIEELTLELKYLSEQVGQANSKLMQDEEKLNNVKNEYMGIARNIQEKTQALKEKEAQINNSASLIKGSLELIANAKKNILELAAKLASAKNEISDSSAKEQIFTARKKRLDLEKAKVSEEKAVAEDSLNKITQELKGLEKTVAGFNLKISAIKDDLGRENAALANINQDIEKLQKQQAGLLSHKEFLEKIKAQYEGIGESLNAFVYLDKLPAQDLDGLVIKIKDRLTSEKGFKLSGEAKPIELDTRRITEEINKLQQNLSSLKEQRLASETRIEELNKETLSLQQGLRNEEIALANKQASGGTVLEQFNKIKEEEELIQMELADVEKEISSLQENLRVCQSRLTALNQEQAETEELILTEENNVSLNSKSREEFLVAITRTKAELGGLDKKLASDQSTVKILEDTYRQDKDSLQSIEKQIKDAQAKKDSLESEIKVAWAEVDAANSALQQANSSLKEAQDKYQQVSVGAGDAFKKIESDRLELDSVKNKLYELQMQDKEIDYKYESGKTRMLDAYKIDLETCVYSPQTEDAITLAKEIEGLKAKLDSYGTVNLVAIEEYDELKKRYDFLVQQQNDLLSAKESLHQAILKINRTTKQMFLETFEKVRLEFRNYFRLMFNGGDAQLFLVDEHDPLESGIEIICRPPGKKLQNVLLLSGGEKSMSAIALIFSIFKVKPSPFCILDEIDAALDEANVDRFSRMLQEFAKGSQFIVITHNKKTIVNADVMYGITMEESGVSKIVSVKFAKDSARRDKEPQEAVPEAV